MDFYYYLLHTAHDGHLNAGFEIHYGLDVFFKTSKQLVIIYYHDSAIKN